MLKIESRGAKRLSILLGVLGLFAYIFWLVSVAISGGDVTFSAKTIFLGFIAGPALSFTVPFGLTRAVAWVVEGFGKHDR